MRSLSRNFAIVAILSVVFNRDAEGRFLRAPMKQLRSSEIEAITTTPTPLQDYTLDLAESGSGFYEDNAQKRYTTPKIRPCQEQLDDAQWSWQGSDEAFDAKERELNWLGIESFELEERYDSLVENITAGLDYDGDDRYLLLVARNSSKFLPQDIDKLLIEFLRDELGMYYDPTVRTTFDVRSAQLTLEGVKFELGTHEQKMQVLLRSWTKRTKGEFEVKRLNADSERAKIDLEVVKEESTEAPEQPPSVVVVSWHDKYVPTYKLPCDDEESRKEIEYYAGLLANVEKQFDRYHAKIDEGNRVLENRKAELEALEKIGRRVNKLYKRKDSITDADINVNKVI